MLQLILKAAVTGILVVAIAEVSKRSSLFAAILASLPLTSVLAFLWMHFEGQSDRAVIDLSYGIFWMVIPSLVFFLILPALLKAGLGFFPAMGIASAGMAGFYPIFMRLIRFFGVV